MCAGDKNTFDEERLARARHCLSAAADMVIHMYAEKRVRILVAAGIEVLLVHSTPAGTHVHLPGSVRLALDLDEIREFLIDKYTDAESMRIEGLLRALRT